MQQLITRTFEELHLSELAQMDAVMEIQEKLVLLQPAVHLLQLLICALLHNSRENRQLGKILIQTLVGITKKRDSNE